MSYGVCQFSQGATDFFDLITVNAIEKWQRDRARSDSLCQLKESGGCPTRVDWLEVNRREVATDADATHNHFLCDGIPVKLREFRP